MAVLNTANSLYDLLSQTSPDSQIRKAVELGLRKHPVFQVLPQEESNDTSVNQTVQRNSLPVIGYARFNRGITPTKATFRQVKDPLAQLEALTNIDERLWKKNGWGPDWRLNQELAYVEAMWQQVERDFFYSDHSLDVDKWNGMSVRYDVANQDRDTYGYYMMDAGGTGSTNTSAWLINMDNLNGVCGVYAKGLTAGLQMKDMGLQRNLDDTGNPYYIYESLWTWATGLAVKNPGSSVRICNIDVDEFGSAATAAIDFSAYLTAARKLIEVDTGNLVLLMNKGAANELDFQTARDTTRRWDKMEDAFGKPVSVFRDVPILETDMLASNETTVTGTFQTDIKA